MTKAAPKKGKTAGGKTILVTQTGSMFRKKPGMRETLIGLGLGKIRRTRELPDTPETRGMIRKVHHLVAVKEKA